MKEIYPFFIEYKAELVGRILLVKSNNILGIYDLTIMGKYRNLGIGSRVLRFIIDEFPSNKFIQTYYSNQKAIKLYSSLGFRELDRLYYYKG
jgi:ribosomal protein S18 acetylase RimI-like enzyme